MNSIKTSLILIAIAIVCGGLIASEVNEYRISQGNELQELEELTTIKVNRLSESLALPLWEIDKEWTERVIDSEMDDKRIYAMFVEADGKLFVGKQRNQSWAVVDSTNAVVDSTNHISGDYLVQTRPILRAGENIGSVKVYLTKQFMQKLLSQRLLRKTVNVALLALLMVIILVASLNRLVVRRLQRMLEATAAIAAGDYSVELAVPQHDEIGQLAAGINSMTESIRQRQEALKASESRFRALVDNATDAFLLIDRSGRIVDVNRAACESLGYSREALLARSVPDVDEAFSVADIVDLFARIERGEAVTVEGSQRRSDGSTFPVEVRIGRLEQHGELFAIALVRDVSDRKQAEAKVRRYSQAMEQSGEAIVITDAEGKIEHVNPAFTEITGYNEEEAVGQKASLLKSGNQDAGFYEKLWDTIAYGQTWQGKVINKKKSGQLYPAMLTISPVRNDAGITSHYVGIQQNLEQFEALEAQFHQAQKMEAIGTLVGGIAHDFNNTLAGITGNLYLAKKAAREMPDVIRRLDSVEKLSFGAAAMIQQLLTFSRKGVVEMAPVTISSFLKETIKLQHASLPEDVDLEYSINDTDMLVKGDINQLQQVLMNLINNAYDAVQARANPAIAISLDHYHADKEFFKKHEGLEKSEYACISVIDNGTGISDEHLEHVYEPFFTTKEPGRGTGLGLAMVYGAIKTHGGVIDIETSITEPAGTTVKLYLPLLEAGHVAASTAPEERLFEGSGETILLVDDNETVLDTGRDVLEGLGYKVLTAEDGLGAIECYSERQDDIDLVILDVVMPRLGGVDALKQLREINPNVKAIFATGYDKLSTLGSRGKALDEKVISKPFAVSRLSRLIREALTKE